jgi:hypothetical protein
LIPTNLRSFLSIRGVAQPGSALRSGRRGRWFESSRPDFALHSFSVGGLCFFIAAVLKMTKEGFHLTIKSIGTRIAVILISLISIHCASYSEPPLPMDSCDNLIDNFEAARNAYINDPSNRDKCIAVKTAGATLLDCPSLSTSEKEDYKDIIDAIYCN